MPLFRILCVFLLLVPCSSYSQDSSIKHITLHFASGSHEIDEPERTGLTNILIAPVGKKISQIRIEGHTDDLGSIEDNEQLSRQRAEAVRNYIVQQLNDTLVNITLAWYGEKKPLANNAIPPGMAMNRRAELTIIFEDDHYPTISSFYQLIEPASQLFCIENKRDTTLVCKQGTMVFIPAGSFTSSSCSCVSVEIKEALNKSDIIKNNLSSTAGNWPLISQSMVSVEFKCASQSLMPGKDYIIFAPTDSNAEGSKIFQGVWQDAQTIDWQNTPASTLNRTSANKVIDCNKPFADVVLYNPDCSNCAFVFCGMGKKIGGLFSKSSRNDARIWSDCKKRGRTISINSKKKQSMSKTNEMLALYGQQKGQPQPDTVTDFCGVLRNIYKLSGKPSREEMIRSLKNIQENGNPLKVTSLDELQYSVYNASFPGWSNIDWMMKIPGNQLTSMEVSLAPSAYNDCKLIFKNRRTIIPGTRKEMDHYVFPLIPKDEAVWVLVISTKAKSGMIAYDLQEVNTGRLTITPQFREIRIEEFTSLLETLNK